MHEYGLGLLMRANGVHRKQVAQVLGDAHLREVVSGIFWLTKTSNARRAGVRLDGVQIEALPAELKGMLSVPTFICHAANDPLASPRAASRLAASIPGVEYLEIEDGGHLFFVVHSGRVVPAIERFLSANAPK